MNWAAAAKDNNPILARAADSVHRQVVEIGK